MSWILWLLGVVIIAIFALVAVGAFGQISDEEVLDSDVEFRPGMKLPLSLLGYRKDVVDALLEKQFQESLHKKHD
jgi:hypothetical protein